MQCHGCHKLYSKEARTPRLLPSCGHTVCESCIIQGLTNNIYNCPQCQTCSQGKGYQCFPKNIAVLNIGYSSSKTEQCSRHGKKVQAFCEKEKELVCIDCILQVHKSHSIVSLKQASSKEIQLLTFSRSLCSQSQQRIKKGLSHLDQQYQMVQKKGQSAMSQLTNFYNQLRRIINYQQDQARNKISLAISADQTYLHSCEEQMSDKLKAVKKFKQMDTGKQSDYQLLLSSQKRVRLIQKFSLKQDLSSQLSSSYQFNKQQHLSSVIKKLSSIKFKPNKPFSKKSKQVIGGSIKVKRKQLKQKELLFDLQKRQIQMHNKQPQDNYQKFLKALEKSQIMFSQPSQSSRTLLGSSRILDFDTHQKIVYLLGGFSQGKYLPLMKYGLYNQDWTISSIQMSRTKFASVNCDGKILMIGGKKQGVRTGECQVLDQNGKCIRNAFKLIGVRSGHGAVYLNGWIYVIGGNNGQQILNLCQAYNAKTGAYKRLADLKQKRDQLAVVIGKDNKIYAIGGCGQGNKCLNTVQCYDIQKNQWRLTPHLNSARRALGAASLADGIYAIGGFDGHTYLNSVQRFDQSGRRWIQISSMNQSRCTHAVISSKDNQSILVFGGFDNRALGSIEKYDALSGRWEFLGEMPDKLFMHCAILQG